jgi:hypothetical protein
MPGEVITIDPANYPNLAKIEDGEVELKVMGTKSSDEDGNISIETTSIEQINANPAKKSLKEMKKPSMPMAAKESMMAPEEEEGY